jgi:hypothetical protein
METYLAEKEWEVVDWIHLAQDSVLLKITAESLTGNERNNTQVARFEVLTAVKTPMLFFWIVTPCGLLGRYQRFEGTY